MRVIVSVQSKSASSRGLVHYIAHSKTEAMREATGREIFGAECDDLTVEKANRFLQSDIAKKRPANDELHHLVISLKTEDFERLGADEKERQNSFRKITRRVMESLEKETKADNLNWVAAIHQNTENPHVHVAVNKNFFDEELQKQTLTKIPRKCLPHYEKTAGEKSLKNGVLIEAAVRSLDKIIAEKNLTQNRSSQSRPFPAAAKENKPDAPEKIVALDNERNLLATAIRAKFQLDKTRESLAALEDYGHLRRFHITDAATGQTRRVSLDDLARQKEGKTGGTDAGKATEKRIRAVLHNLLVRENKNLQNREREYEKVKPAAESLRRNCKRTGKKLPAPSLTAEEIEILQNHSLEKGDFRTAFYFERVRRTLAAERGEPPRSDEEIGRLKAQQFIAQLQIKEKEKNLRDFHARKFFRKFEIGDEKHSLYTLAEQSAKENAKEQTLAGNIGKALRKIGPVAEKETLSQTAEKKLLVHEKLTAETVRLSEDLSRAKKILQTLEKFAANEKEFDRKSIPPKFSAAELAAVELLAFDLKSADAYRENWEFQKRLIASVENKEQAEKDSPKKSKENTIAGRALAREVLCEIEAARAKEEYTNFKKHKDFRKFEITNPKTGVTKFVALAEVRFDSRGSILDQTLEYFFENSEKREIRHTLEKQIKVRETELKENSKAANNLLQFARDIAADFKTKSFFGGTRDTHPPIFTPPELNTIERRIAETKSASEAKNLQKILDSTDVSSAKSLATILQSFASEKENAESIGRDSLVDRETPVQIVKDEKNSPEKTPPIREIKTEILDLDRGR